MPPTRTTDDAGPKLTVALRADHVRTPRSTVRVMTYRVPHLAWERARRIAPRDGRPAVEVPAELSALSPAARALLTTRLAWRCGAHRVLLGPGPEPAITFVGLELETFDTPARAVVDEALATVERDAAAGWTPADEDERHAPLDWT